MDIRFSVPAKHDFSRLSQDVRERIVTKLRFYADQKDPIKFSKRLVNSQAGSFRFRVGNYRAFFDIIDDAIIILKISKRDEAYE